MGSVYLYFQVADLSLSVCHSFAKVLNSSILCSVAFGFSRNRHELAGGLQAVGAAPKVNFVVLIDGLSGGLLNCDQEWTVVQG